MSDEVTIDPDAVYSISVAAELLHVSPSTVRDLERRGKLTCTRTPGNQRRIAGSELLRLRRESLGTPRKTSAPPGPHIALSVEDVKARQAWLGQWVARAQRDLPADTPAEIRLRLAADLDRALGPWSPASPAGDVEPLVKSLVARAITQAASAQENAERREMKGELIDFGLARLRRGIDALPNRLVGSPNSHKRQHVRAMLRDQFRGVLQTRLHGDETWDQVGELTDEFLAAWVVKQTPATRIPNAVKLLAAGVTGLVGGATAAAALSPTIRTRAAALKGPLVSAAAEFLKRISTPPPSASSPPNPVSQAPAPPSSLMRRSRLGRAPYDYRRTVRTSRPFPSTFRAGTPKDPVTADTQASDAPATNLETPPAATPGGPDPAP